jgi:plasmid maintenance system antidote protein VapI
VPPSELLVALGGISQRQLAQDLGLKSHGLIGHLLSGRRRSCTPELAVKIEEFAGVGPGSLFELVAPLEERRADAPRETAA